MSGVSRWNSFVTGEYEYMKQYPDAPADRIPDGLDEVNAEFFPSTAWKEDGTPTRLAT